VSLAALIAAEKAGHGTSHAVSCRALGMSQAWFYKWRRGDGSPRRQRRKALAATVGYLFHKHQQTYGSPRITPDLRDMGWRLPKNTVATLMTEQGLVAHRKHRRRGTTKPDKSARKTPDLLRRDFTLLGAPNVAWVGNLTEIPTDEGKLHLYVLWNPSATRLDFVCDSDLRGFPPNSDSVDCDGGAVHRMALIVDLHSRWVPGFAMDIRHDAALALAALCMAIAVRGGRVAGVIFHTDQGGEYTGEVSCAVFVFLGWKSVVSHALERKDQRLGLSAPL